jgi:hypothetical protein
LKAVGARMSTLLEKAIAAPSRPKPGILRPSGSSAQISGSGRAQAIQILKKSSELEKQVRERVRALKNRKLPKEAKDCLQTMLDVIRLQRLAQSKLLADIGKLKAKMKGYDWHTYDSLARDRELTGKILANMLPEDGPADADG